MSDEYIMPKTSQLVKLPEMMMEHIGFKTNGSFVEIGAFDGKQWSNTWELALLGWRGLMCEPNIEVFRQCYDNHKEHEVSVLPIAISNQCGLAKLYLGGSLSTIRLEMIDIYNSIDWSRIAGLDKEKFIIVPTLTLDALLDFCNWEKSFDLLVIDVEGSELQVLETFNIEQWTPKMIVIETHEKMLEKAINYKADEISKILSVHDYVHIHGDTINSVFVRK